ncbi:MAG TPA: hypothetical protein VFC68_02350 [Treponemataceae bacterium]|nr:hypothetical protein [Treponemataceae bacterium]
MSNEISPEIAALLNNDSKRPARKHTPLFHTDTPKSPEKTDAPYAPVNLMITKFEPVTQFFATTHTTDVFFDTEYYKKALSGQGQASQRLHNLLSKYLTCKDSKDRTVYRQQILAAYWEFVKLVACKIPTYKTNMYKRMVLRYAILLPSLFTPEQKEMFSTAIIKNTSNEPVYYLDEWFLDIGAGRLKTSTTDESRTSKRKSADSTEDTSRLMQLKSKSSGRLQSAENYLTMQESKRAMIEAELKSRIDLLCDHATVPGCDNHRAPYTDSQKKLFSDITEKLRQLQKINKVIETNLADYQSALETCNSLEQKISAGPEVTAINESDLQTEIQTIRQMAKLSCGRRGNHFPIFTREFFHNLPKETGFRENVISILAWIESIDVEAFCRVHKNIKNRIIPFVILVPTYGDIGFCWEPFDRYNRVTSRARIIVPMYGKNIKLTTLRAVADLRWQVAKEKASYYWMEEGLTGQYYHYYNSRKLKGDIKSYFINDYVIWMTKESDGVQKLDKEVRAVFWRNMPFADTIKEELKKRSLVYQDLFQKDINRGMSDGY